VATFLSLVNGLRTKLRSGGELSAFPTGTDPGFDAQKVMINEAAREILESNDWSFDRRSDVLIDCPKRSTGTAFAATPTAKDIATVIVESGESTEAISMSYIVADTWRARLRVTDASINSEASYTIDSATPNGDATLTLTLDQTYKGEDHFTAASGNAWEIFVHEFILPTTVRKIHGIQHMEQPLDLQFVGRDQSFDNVIPRPHDTFDNDPAVAWVGEFIGSTYDTTGAGSTASKTWGLGLMTWPIQTTRQILHTNTQYRHAALTVAADTFTAVPEQWCDLITWRAAEMAFATTQRNPQQAQATAKIVGERFAAALDVDRIAPTRRRVLHPFNPNRVRGPINPRWSAQVVPAP
jgi:hypothetical protein